MPKKDIPTKISIGILAVLALFLVFSSPSNAAEQNFGQCMANSQPGAQKYNAPGQSGNGPLVVNDGEFHWPKAFDGAVACYRSS